MRTTKSEELRSTPIEAKRSHVGLTWAVRGGLVAGVAASVFANAMHAQPSLVGRVIAAWAPLAFFAVVEFLSYMPAGRSLASVIRFGAAAMVGAVAAWVSYWHMSSVAAKYGEQYSHLLPLSVDGLIVVTSMCLFELKRRRRTADPAGVAAAEEVAGVPVEVRTDNRNPGVYRALGVDPVPPLYIGSTIDLEARIRSHKTTAEWFPQVVRWTFEPYLTLDDAQIAEVALIESEQPVHNKRSRNPARQPTRRPYPPPGTVIETVPASVDVSALPPRRSAPLVMPQRSKRGGDVERRDAYAARVVAGERAADIAKEADISKRSVELWVKSYRERHLTSIAFGSAEDLPTSAQPQVNGHEFHADGPAEVAAN